MPLTFNELKQRLMRLDEITLMEILNITAEDLVERFEDIISDHYDELSEELKDEDNFSD